MIGIPVPLVIAAVAIAFAVVISSHLSLTAASRALFVAMCAVIAVEAVLVALRFAFGVMLLVPLQRVLPLWVGPLAYLGFLALGLSAAHLKRAVWLHLTVAAAIALLLSFVPGLRPLFDFAIAASYSFYVVLLAALWMGGTDRLSLVSLASAAGLRRWIAVAAGLLVVNLVIDTMIALDFARQGGVNAPAIISFGGLGFLLAAGLTIAALLGLKPARRPVVADTDRDISERAADLLRSTHLYRDPSLTLTRLARRLGITDRALSEAINKCNGVNVSQFINRFRVNDAATRLKETDDTVSEILDGCGFLTRSNFYREFRNIHGMSPGEYRQADATDEPVD